jgi:hypothetical protein
VVALSTQAVTSGAPWCEGRILSRNEKDRNRGEQLEDCRQQEAQFRARVTISQAANDAP